jgi:Uma2 family endonuclease
MGEPPSLPMEIDEFLRWDGEGDTRYQLRDGIPVAKRLETVAHGSLWAMLAARLGQFLDRKAGWGVLIPAGLVSRTRPRTFHEADIALTATPGRATDQFLTDPVVLAEVVSAATADDDRRAKQPDYRAIPSVQQIVLVDSRYVYCEVHRRQPDERWLVDLLRDRDGILRLDSIGFEARLGELYINVPLEAA